MILEIFCRYGLTIVIICGPMILLIIGAAISDRKKFDEL